MSRRWVWILWVCAWSGVGCVSTRTHQSPTCRAQVNRCVEQCQAQRQMGEGDWRNMEYACVQRCYDLCR